MRRLALIAVLLLPAALNAQYARQADDHRYWSREADLKADRYESDVEVCSEDGRVLAKLSKPTKRQLVEAFAKAKAVSDNGAVDSLDEVNRQRSLRGLRPYLRDDGLSKAAADCAAYRAANRIHGHTNDFAFVPKGSSASCAGCAAWAEGFGACEIFGNWSYAGAAYVVGSDGLKYCHVFYK